MSNYNRSLMGKLFFAFNLKRITLIFLIITLVPKSSLAQEMKTYADIIEPLMPSVVNIYTARYTNSKKNQQSNISSLFTNSDVNQCFDKYNIPVEIEKFTDSPRTSLGSGFIIGEDGYIVTNYHVINNADEISVRLYDGQELSAEVIGTKPKFDLALIKVNSLNEIKKIKFGDSSKVRIGDIVIAIGNPMGLGAAVSKGIISAKGRDLVSSEENLLGDFIQTDASINAGNSGGPLYNIDGEVIGLNTAIADVNDGKHLGIGFAIPSNRVKMLCDELEDIGRISRGRLGLDVQDLEPEKLEELQNKKITGGVLIVDVLAGGNAELVGLKPDDIIYKINDQEAVNVSKLQEYVEQISVGENINFTVLRGEEELSLVTDFTEILNSNDEKNEVNKEVNQRENHKRIKENQEGKSKEVNQVELDGISLKESNLEDSVIIEITGTNQINKDLFLGDIIISANQIKINSLLEFINLYNIEKKQGKSEISLLISRKKSNMFVTLNLK